MQLFRKAAYSTGRSARATDGAAVDERLDSVQHGVQAEAERASAGCEADRLLTAARLAFTDGLNAAVCVGAAVLLAAAGATAVLVRPSEPR